MNDSARLALEKEVDKLNREMQFAQQEMQSDLQALQTELQVDFQRKLGPIVERSRRRRACTSCSTSAIPVPCGGIPVWT